MSPVATEFGRGFFLGAGLGALGGVILASLLYVLISELRHEDES